MATLQITKKLRIIPLIGIQSSTFAGRYTSGVCWRLFGWRTHGEIEARGPLPEDYLIDNLKMCAKINRFDGGHDEALCADLGFFLGMLRGGVLTPAGTLPRTREPWSSSTHRISARRSFIPKTNCLICSRPALRTPRSRSSF